MGNAIKELHKDGLEKLIVAGINTLIVENKDASNKSQTTLSTDKSFKLPGGCSIVLAVANLKTDGNAATASSSNDGKGKKGRRPLIRSVIPCMHHIYDARGPDRALRAPLFHDQLE